MKIQETEKMILEYMQVGLFNPSKTTEIEWLEKCDEAFYRSMIRSGLSLQEVERSFYEYVNIGTQNKPKEEKEMMLSMVKTYLTLKSKNIDYQVIKENKAEYATITGLLLSCTNEKEMMYMIKKYNIENINQLNQVQSTSLQQEYEKNRTKIEEAIQRVKGSLLRCVKIKPSPKYKGDLNEYEEMAKNIISEIAQGFYTEEGEAKPFSLLTYYARFRTNDGEIVHFSKFYNEFQHLIQKHQAVALSKFRRIAVESEKNKYNEKSILDITDIRNGREITESMKWQAMTELKEQGIPPLTMLYNIYIKQLLEQIEVVEKTKKFEQA